MRIYKKILCLFVCVMFLSIFAGISASKKSYERHQLTAIEENIKKAALTCYSIEGYYPSNIQYLKDTYGLVIDDSKINVFYQAAGANLFPDILVTYKGK